MTAINCDWCDTAFAIDGGRSLSPHLLRGAVFCARCKKPTVFAMEHDALVWRPGKLDMPGVQGAPPLAVEMLNESRLCYGVAAVRGAVAMSRAAVEQALKAKGIIKGTLEQKIDEAKGEGLLDDREVSLAHSSRLIGNEALHDAVAIDLSLVPAALSAAIAIVGSLRS